MRKAKAITALAITLLIVSLLSPHGTTIGTARALALQAAPLELDTTQNIQVSNDTSANVSLSWTVPQSPLADDWRASFFGDAIPRVELGQVYDMPENMTVHPTISLEQGVNDSSLPGDVNYDGVVGLKDLVTLANAYGTTNAVPTWNPACDFSAPYGSIGLSDLVTLAQNYGKTRQPPAEISEPVRDPFFLSIVQQEAAWPGFQVNASDAKVVPWGLNNETSVTAEAYAPQVAVSMGTFYRIPSETNDTIDMDAGLVLLQIQFIQSMLESMPYPYNVTYTYNSSVTYHLPEGAQIINAPQLNGLNWTIDWGGGTVMYANVSPSNSTVTVSELWTVSSQNITATDDYLEQAFYQYKQFNIDYALGNITASPNEPTSLSDWQWSTSPSWTVNWGSWVWKPIQSSNFNVVLKVTPTLTLGFYIGIGGKFLLVKSFEAYMSITPALDIHADVSGKGPYSNSWSTTLVNFALPFGFWLGPVHVGGQFLYKVTASLALTASTINSLPSTYDVTADYKLSNTLQIGTQWSSSSGFSPIWTYTNGNTHSVVPSGLGSISLTPTLTSRLELQLWKADVFVEIDPYAPIVITYAPSPFSIPPTQGTWTIALKVKGVEGGSLFNWNWGSSFDEQLATFSGTW